MLFQVCLRKRKKGEDEQTPVSKPKQIKPDKKSISEPSQVKHDIHMHAFRRPNTSKANNLTVNFVQFYHNDRRSLYKTF